MTKARYYPVDPDSPAFAQQKKPTSTSRSSSSCNSPCTWASLKGASVSTRGGRWISTLAAGISTIAASVSTGVGRAGCLAAWSRARYMKTTARPEASNPAAAKHTTRMMRRVMRLSVSADEDFFFAGPVVGLAVVGLAVVGLGEGAGVVDVTRA